VPSLLFFMLSFFLCMLSSTFANVPLKGKVTTHVYGSSPLE
jgi:cytochrome c oxidase assembly protein Cox11